MGFDFADIAIESTHGVCSLGIDNIMTTGLTTYCIICDNEIKFDNHTSFRAVCDDCKKAIKQIKTMPCVVNRYSTQE